jgi:hypothetical protein
MHEPLAWTTLAKELRKQSQGLTWHDLEISAVLSRLTGYKYLKKDMSSYPGGRAVLLTKRGSRKAEFVMGYKDEDPDPKVKFRVEKGGQLIYQSPHSTQVGHGSTLSGTDQSHLVALIEAFDRQVKSGDLEVEADVASDAVAAAKEAAADGKASPRLRNALRHLYKIAAGAAVSAVGRQLAQELGEVVENLRDSGTPT